MDSPGTSHPGTPTAAGPPPLQSLFRAAEHGRNVCVLAVLTWTASCDGAIADDELALLRGVAAAIPGGEMLPAVIDVARLGRPDDLEFACRYLRNKTDRSEKVMLARLLITVAAQDGHVTVAENHVLRFMADLLGISPRKFAGLFEELTRRPFPDVGDVSSVEWWRRRESGEQAAAPAGGWGTTGPTPAASDANRSGSTASSGESAAAPAASNRATALRMFDLAEGASPDEIHSAYRRLAKARHPDRFAALGPAAQATAAAAFQRLREAYEVLSSTPSPVRPDNSASVARTKGRWR